jgi:sporulation protein YlmC with PRC-barrel domain
MMLLSQITGLPVMDTAEAHHVGIVDGLVLAARPPRVLALRLKKTSHTGSFLTWENVQAIGHDAVMARTHALQDADDDLATPATVCKDLIGRRILTAHGEEAGTLEDLDIDTDTGAVLTLHTANGHHPGAALTGIGSYALIVTTTPA